MKRILSFIILAVLFLTGTAVYAETDYESYMFDIEDFDTEIVMTMWFEYPSSWDIAEGFVVNLIPDADTTISLSREPDNMDIADQVYLISKNSNNTNIKTEELEDDHNAITKVSFKCKSDNFEEISEKYFHEYFIGIDVDNKVYYFSLGYSGDTPENAYEADMDHIAQTLKVVSFKEKQTKEKTSSVDEKILGTYHATYNMKDALNKEFKESGMELQSDIVAEFILQLNADGSFAFDVDGKGFHEAITQVLAQDGLNMISGMMEEQGITEDQFEKIAIASGYDSFDDFVDDMIKTITNEMGDSFIEDLEEDVHFEGEFEVDGNKLSMM